MARLKLNDFITIEAESNPGVMSKYLIADINDSGYLKLVYQGDVCTKPGRQQLINYMTKNNFDPKILATILGVSRSTVYRYLSGARVVPQSVFDLLGIRSVTYLQSMASIDTATKSLSDMKDQLCSIITMLGGRS